MRRDYKYIKVQLEESQLANNAKRTIIGAQSEQIKQMQIKLNLSSEYSTKLEGKYKKIKVGNFFLKVAIPTAFVAGFLLAK